MAKRANNIEEILRQQGGRMKVADINNDLASLEGADPEILSRNSAVPSAVRNDNLSRMRKGQTKLFRSYDANGDGDEDRGFVSLVAMPREKFSDNVPSPSADGEIA